MAVFKGDDIDGIETPMIAPFLAWRVKRVSI